MQEIMDYLTRQISLSEDVFNGLRNMKHAVKTSISGKEIGSAAKELESLLGSLNDFAAWQDDILTAWDADNLEEAILSQPGSAEQDEALELLGTLTAWQKKLKTEIMVVGELLTRSKKFIDYSVNVLAAARVDGTYGPPGTRESGVSGRKIYEANV